MIFENKIYLLFTNTGVHLFASTEETSIDDFHRVLSININVVYYTLKEIIPIMKSQKSGNVVLMVSDQSFVDKGKSSVYGMTKGAISQLLKKYSNRQC